MSAVDFFFISFSWVMHVSIKLSIWGNLFVLTSFLDIYIGPVFSIIVLFCFLKNDEKWVTQKWLINYKEMYQIIGSIGSRTT